MIVASNLTFWRSVLFVVLPILAISILSVTIDIAYGQTNSTNYVLRRVAIWDLFYRGMVAAFVVGALVQGSIVYVSWRFRESNKKTHPQQEPREDGT
jgi:heme/copper-type cytochrome/quinol oxidase subunit 2